MKITWRAHHDRGLSHAFQGDESVDEEDGEHGVAFIRWDGWND